MFISQKSRIITMAEKIFIAMRVQDNVSANQELAKRAIYSSMQFHKTLTEIKIDDKLPHVG